MEPLADPPTLLTSTLQLSGVEHDVERAWAFLVFCGVIECTAAAHGDFVQSVEELGSDPQALSEAMLDFATARGEVLDVGSELASQLRSYFDVGATLRPPSDTDPALETVASSASEAEEPGHAARR